MATVKVCNADFLWNSQDSLNQELKTGLTEAIEANWSYARRFAWSYLKDETMAWDIMEEAIEVVQTYALRFSPPPSEAKLTARLRSQIRRTAKQIANRKSRETCAGSLQDLDMYSPSSNPDPLQQILLKEVFHLLSPQAKEIATWIWMGYSWREIGRICGIDHSTVRLAFRREAHAALTRLEPRMPIERRP